MRPLAVRQEAARLKAANVGLIEAAILRGRLTPTEAREWTERLDGRQCSGVQAQAASRALLEAIALPDGPEKIRLGNLKLVSMLK